ncbi:MAG: hypothetical protein JNJ54_19650 [Myxococcaceae bacterium]|nr:hypothetical protein [Myxococcaceae bacterium]
MPRAYSMSGVMGAADRAVRLATDFLTLKAPGSLVHDVQEDPRFQHRGVDLLWDQGDGKVLGVEVKGDRQGRRRGNYFFELISNAEKDAPGCFLYSTADLLLYVFLDVREVHCLELKAVRDWFVPRTKDYPLKATKTRTGAVLYTTVGAIVPLGDVKAAVPQALTVHRFALSTPG